MIKHQLKQEPPWFASAGFLPLPVRGLTLEYVEGASAPAGLMRSSFLRILGFHEGTDRPCRCSGVDDAELHYTDIYTRARNNTAARGVGGVCKRGTAHE